MRKSTEITKNKRKINNSIVPERERDRDFERESRYAIENPIDEYKNQMQEECNATHQKSKKNQITENLQDRLRLLGVPLRLRLETSLRASEPLSDILLTSESDIFTPNYSLFCHTILLSFVDFVEFTIGRTLMPTNSNRLPTDTIE